MIINHLMSITIAYVLDLIIGDPKGLPHPVRMMGRLIHFLDECLNRGNHRRGRGILFLGLVILTVLVISLTLVLLSYRIHPIIGIIVEAMLIATTIATKSLKEAALEVYTPLQQGNIQLAREKLSWIVARDTDQLEEAEIVRGAVETVAENTSDGIIAPLFWAFVGGAPLALIYRVVNTCDSMVGYRNERYSAFGWASARFDDLLNYLPSRITAVVMLFVNRPHLGRTRKTCLQIVRRDARKHLSPNSGYGEATVASLLGVQLGGTNTYQGEISRRAQLGDPLQPLQIGHILATNRMMERTVFFYIIFSWIGGGILSALT